MLKNVGIIGFGSYLPFSRIKISEIASVWRKEEKVIEDSLGITEKTVASLDEDTVTMGVEAGRNALLMAKIDPGEISAIYVGSESHPYAVNPSSTIIGEALGMGTNYLAADLEFACKAATAGMQALAGLLETGLINYGLVIGADAAQAKPHDILEYTAASGAVAFILGNKKQDFLVEILDFTSFSSDTPDFWRRDGIPYPSHQGRFSGEPAYFAHVQGAAQGLLSKTKMKPADFNYCVFHMPNGKFPCEVGKRLGFDKKQLEPGLIVSQIGNPYSASSILGLCAVLEAAKPGELIFLTSYGSGAGADSFILKTSKLLPKKRKLVPGFKSFLEKKNYISYPDYLKFTGRI
ncbi:hydroxymethylglutaryl-CoA synthase [Candidatus Gottesmanbacteria bacterium]|nr:hydroxymethylglutaryl-CoA synthase [Candidatus Gottesmanbacteria bacterium]